MAEEKQPERMLDIQRIYLKDLSLETPNTPQVFREEWKPEVNVDLNIAVNSLEQELYDVALSVTVTAKMEEKSVFLVEVQQAGIFHIAGFEGEELEHLTNAYCPTVLFPYARAAISDVITRASFPQFNLAPINFELFYQQQKEEQAASKDESETAH